MDKPQTNTNETFDQWAVVEIMGHQTFAGRVTEEPLFGTNLLRIDVPAITSADGEVIPAYTKYFGGGSIYSLTLCTEETARRKAHDLWKRPVHLYEPTSLLLRREVAAIAAAHTTLDDRSVYPDKDTDLFADDDPDDNADADETFPGDYRTEADQ